MDPRSIFRDVIAEAGRLGLAPWERLVLILAVALLLVMGKRGFAVLRTLKLEPHPPVADENGPQPSGQPLDTDPDHPGGDTPSGA